MREMNGKQYKIYAIIVTWNAMRHSWIDRCLHSLQASTVMVTPIVIDNCSTDDTRRHVPSAYPDVVWLPQDINLGFGQANNVGFRYAIEHDADYVLLLNQDAAIQPRTLSLLLAQSDGKSLMSPLHLNGDGTDLDLNFAKNTVVLSGSATDYVFRLRNEQGRFETGEICAACWLMPVRMLKEIGGFNPLFFQYGEDNNYYDRMLFHNIKTYLVPAAEMWHDRKIYGNKEIYDNKLIRRTILLAACDINSSFFSAIKEIAWQLKNCYVKKLPRREYVTGTFFKELVWLMFHLKDIIISRKKEKTTGIHWIYPQK
ncbi:glycosyltransferase family 2 protein [Prevotella sp. OH937_COT-195]|uniref:glycosyltransferase family 2 protein n=1 Tax=Prevotella sp. OH937_COT-195 TaxID=2491051 RepID=UPI00131532D7|nr:glycosyltransferase family 2 protein [Prevotella sp. OH937_COT-195]